MGCRGMSVTRSEILSWKILEKSPMKIQTAGWVWSTLLLLAFMFTRSFDRCICINKKAPEIIRSFLFIKLNIKVYCLTDTKGFISFFIVYFLPFFFGAALVAFFAGLATFFATTFFVAVFFTAFLGLAEEALLLDFDPLAGLTFLLAVALVLSGLLPFAEETDLSVFFDDGGFIFNFFFDD